MDELHIHLITRYRQTGWPFFKVAELQNQFGPNITQSLNDLYLQGIIRKRTGGNGPLVELLKYK